jgi:hypothetical protein
LFRKILSGKTLDKNRAGGMGQVPVWHEKNTFNLQYDIFLVIKPTFIYFAESKGHKKIIAKVDIRQTERSF